MEKLSDERDQISSLLSPELINSLEGLEFIARIIVEEFFHGNNRSHKLGVGQEFSQYRSYEPGDDLRLLDWKMYARSERYYIRQSEIDTHITIRFILDTSRSMEHESEGIRKIDLAKVLIAALAYMARNQGDAFGLFSVNKNGVLRLSPNIHPQQFIRLLRMLVQARTESKWPETTIGMEDIYQPGRKDLIIFLTDLYQESEELIDFLRSIKSSRNEVLVLHMIGGNEINFDFEGFHTFKDLETGEEVMADSAKARKLFVQENLRYQNEIKDILLGMEIDYQPFATNDDLSSILTSFLVSRKRLL